MHRAPSPSPTADDGDDGRKRTHSSGALEEEVVLYRHMLALRLVSARMVELQRRDKVAFHSSCIGEEAVIAATVLAARPSDWIFPGVREWGAALVRGLPLADYMHHAFGTAKDPAKGHSAPDHPPARAVRVAPASGLPGAHALQAVGAAWAARIKKDDVATVALFGESATGTGDVHNALNFAGVFKPACVFVCRKDGRKPVATDPARAVAYGIASASVDGSDPVAVLALVRAALARAASGKGATLIEATTTPLVPTTSDPLALGDADPLRRLRGALERDKRLDAASHAAMLAELGAAIDAAVAEAEAASPPAPSTLFEDVYAEVPAHLRAQKESSPWRR